MTTRERDDDDDDDCVRKWTNMYGALRQKLRTYIILLINAEVFPGCDTQLISSSAFVVIYMDLVRLACRMIYRVAHTLIATALQFDYYECVA